MPHMLYETKEYAYQYLRDIKLSGKHGDDAPLHKFVMNKNNKFDFGWHLNSKQILSEISDANPDNQQILIDITPYRPTLFFCSLSDVWGYSYESWTPIVFGMKAIYVDQNLTTPPFPSFSNLSDDERKDKIKKMLPIPEHIGLRTDGSIIKTVVYINGGWGEGRWTYGRSGFVNGAALWPDALQYFCDNAFK